ncbi:MAG: rhomboid family intramembrane serine protease [Acidobacteriota bacterium]|nr:rhomboid family intramembrane serine protease [Acidobacteriota bacterium]
MNYETEEEPPQPSPRITPEEFLAERKRAIRRRSWWAIGIGAVLVALHLLVFFFVIAFKEQFLAQYPEAFDGEISWKILFQSLTFLLGLFALIAGIWGLYEARRITLEDLIPTPEAVEFLRQARDTVPYFSYILVACLVVVTLFQWSIEDSESFADFGARSSKIAGLVKPLVWEGEWWRLLTYATLHGIFPLHLYFNAQALYGFGGLIEFLSNRAHLGTVFLLSIIGGGLLSLFFMPDVQSIGASGGIMGLIGYMAIYGYRRKRQLPPDFLRSMLVNISFIAAFGIIAYQIVDNFGHLGGLLTGAIYGFAQIPRDLHKNPRQAGATAEAFGLISMGVFVFVSILTILLLLQYIKF